LYQGLESECREQFTVTVGTVFERSKISLDKWVFAATLMASSKKGISSKQIERMLGVTYKTAWFMTHRLREALKHPAGMWDTPGGTVEADETCCRRQGKEQTPDRCAAPRPSNPAGCCYYSR
jgi:hypothetical protein